MSAWREMSGEVGSRFVLTGRVRLSVAERGRATPRGRLVSRRLGLVAGGRGRTPLRRLRFGQLQDLGRRRRLVCAVSDEGTQNAYGYFVSNNINKHPPVNRYVFVFIRFNTHI